MTKVEKILKIMACAMQPGMYKTKDDEPIYTSHDTLAEKYAKNYEVTEPQLDKLLELIEFRNELQGTGFSALGYELNFYKNVMSYLSTEISFEKLDPYFQDPFLMFTTTYRSELRTTNIKKLADKIDSEISSTKLSVEKLLEADKTSTTKKPAFFISTKALLIVSMLEKLDKLMGNKASESDKKLYFNLKMEYENIEKTLATRDQPLLEAMITQTTATTDTSTMSTTSTTTSTTISTSLS